MKAGLPAIPNLRWRICALLALATALNYLDRQSLPVLASEIRKTIPISDSDFSWLQSSFLIAYGIMYAVGGRIMDAFGVRRGYTMMILVWSAATMLHGMAYSVWGLIAARFLLGLGEGGSFPGAAKAVSEWFPAQERSVAFGIFNTGSSLGAVLAPPMIALIATYADWRWVFLFAGSFGVIWSAAWWRVYELPSAHSRISPEELDYIEHVQPSDRRSETKSLSWTELLRYRQTWGLMIAKFLSDSAWYFYIFWLPKYLSDARGLDIRQIGYYAWVPYAFAGLGSLVGGSFSSYLIHRNVSLDASRKISLGISAALLPTSLLIAASPLALALLFFSLAMLGHQFWSTIIQTLSADIYPSHAVGSVAGLMGAVGSFGGVVFGALIAAILNYSHSYTPVLTIAGLLHPLSFFVILLVVRRIEPVHTTAQSQ